MRGPHVTAASSRLPPALNIITLATFAASLSARALDPVLPHVADDFGVSIATAAGFAAVFAFTFAIIQPVLGAAADLFGKARLMIVCLVLLGLANILGAMATSFWLLFASRILAGIGSGGVFPVALSLTSDLVGPEKRQLAIGRTLMGSMTGNLLGASVSGLIGDFLGWRGVLAVLGVLVIVAIAVAPAFAARADASAQDQPVGAQTRLPHHLRQSQRAHLLCGGVHRRLLRARAVSLHRGVPVRTRRNQLSIAGIVIAGFAVGGLFYTLTVSRFLPRLGVNGMMIAGATLVALQLAVVAFGPGGRSRR
jgi:predicted MFS family arabinose efflux permease